MFFVFLNVCDQRTGVGDDLVQRPKPSMYFGLLARSRGPRNRPALSLASAWNDGGSEVALPFNPRSMNSRTNADFGVCRARASSANRSATDSGSFSEIVVILGK